MGWGVILWRVSYSTRPQIGTRVLVSLDQLFLYLDQPTSSQNNVLLKLIYLLFKRYELVITLYETINSNLTPTLREQTLPEAAISYVSNIRRH